MNTYLGIELGSTRIKAVTIDENFDLCSSGSYTWSSKNENGIWTYDLSEAINGFKNALSQIENRDLIKCVGISGMMHGYLVFDKDWNLLTPFRTWQNTISEMASNELTKLFNFNIPQRWSVSNLYQAVLNNEPHVKDIAHLTTLSGYIHYLLTGVDTVGIGEASGMFPIDFKTKNYDEELLLKFDNLLSSKKLPWKLKDILPEVLIAGESAGNLTEEGAKLLDGLLNPGIRFAPPEGDGGTGMVATNSVTPGTGNVSAGTSAFSMIVTEKYPNKVHKEIDVVTTPAGNPVLMAHCNNCTGDSNAWINLFRETARLFGVLCDDSEIFTKLYEISLEGDADCGGITVCNYIAGEHLAGLNSGRPLIVRSPNCNFTLPNFFRAQLYSSMAALKLGMDILESENVKIDSITAHGGLFKTPVVGQKYLAAILNAPVTTLKTAGEGGPYGMALLCAFASMKRAGETLEDFLEERVFSCAEKTVLAPDKTDVEGFNKYFERYKNLLKVEKTACEVM